MLPEIIEELEKNDELKLIAGIAGHSEDLYEIVFINRILCC